MSKTPSSNQSSRDIKWNCESKIEMYLIHCGLLFVFSGVSGVAVQICVACRLRRGVAVRVLAVKLIDTYTRCV